MKYGVNLDLNKNELQNARLQNITQHPTNPISGQFYYNTKDNMPYIWDGTTWKSMSSMSISEIVTLLNSSSLKIDDDNLSSNVNDVISKKHSHSNKTILDAIEQAFTTNLKSKLDSVATGATKVENSDTNGNIRINGIEQIIYTHPIGTNPHGTTKTDIGLGNVDNKSSDTIRNEITTNNITDALGYVPAKKISINLGDNFKNEFTVIHNLGTKDVVITIEEITTGEVVLADILKIDMNTVKFIFGNPPTLNQYKVTLVG